MRELRVSDRITHGSLLALVRGDTDLIRCRAYAPPAVYAVAGPRIHSACDESTYTLTTDFQCVGVSIGEANASAEKARQYVAEAAATTAFIRESLFAGVVSPVDRLLAELGEVWPGGAGVALSQGKPVIPHVIRRWTSGGQANPHIDQRNSAVLADYTFQKRLGVNVYLEVPPEDGGGELELWDEVVEDEAEYAARQRPDYGLSRADLDEPDWTVRPGAGDLLVFDAARVHGVRPLSKGRRVTLACFLGVRETTDEPLAVFA